MRITPEKLNQEISLGFKPRSAALEVGIIPIAVLNLANKTII
jgi:hypothetical protein